MPPLWFELWIFRLPGKGGYSTRPLGTYSSLIIWVEIYVAYPSQYPGNLQRKTDKLEPVKNKYFEITDCSLGVKIS
jgi:hypothetical protein